MTMKLKDLLSERMSPPTFKKTDRVHASVDLPVDILLRRYGTPRQPRGPKPKGFWYAFGNEWIDWVNSEMPQWKSKYSYYYLVDVKGCKLLKMSKFEELIEFSQDFGYDDGNSFYINWSKVAKKYDGIEINPYVFAARMNDDAQWYYGWDVASGCVWRPKKLKLEKVR